MKIEVHTLVKNEESFVWFAINSVIDYVDKVVVWDNGSKDKTTEIVHSIKSEKITFSEKGETSKEGTAKLRQEMLEQSAADWILILDGDEIWWEDSIRELVNILRTTDKDVVVTHPYMLIGDMFHYQEETAGKYHIGGKVGHYNIRAIRKTLGLRIEGIYPNEAFVTDSGVKVQELSLEKMLFFDKPYLHASYLKRSGKDSRKIKYEIGESFSLDFYYPEVFFRPRPEAVPCPWQLASNNYQLIAGLETPLKKIKRRIG